MSSPIQNPFSPIAPQAYNLIMSSTNLNTAPTGLLNARSCWAVVAGGEFERDSDEIAKIKACAIGLAYVDGGFDHNKKIDRTPDIIAGDFDSTKNRAKIDQIKEKFHTDASDSDVNEISTIKTKVITAGRCKDNTDLELAIETITEEDPNSPLIVWGALGGRVDHTLYNLHLLLRYPGTLFFETKDQFVFGLNHKCSDIGIDPKGYKTLTLVALNGPIGQISLISLKDGMKATYEKILFDQPKMINLENIGEATLKIQKGEAIVILDKRDMNEIDQMVKRQDKVHKQTGVTNFSVKKPLLYLVSQISALSNGTLGEKLETDKETIHVLSRDVGYLPKTFKTDVHDTVSLIPFNGPFTNISTEGLAWDFGDNEVGTVAHRDKCSLSNVSSGEFTVNIVEERQAPKRSPGELLVIINKRLQDPEIGDKRMSSHSSSDGRSTHSSSASDSA